MCEFNLRTIYFLFVSQGGRRFSILESYINYVDGMMVFSEDFLRNEPAMYEELFSLGCRGYMLDLLKKLMAELKGMKFEESVGVLEVLEFVQGVCAAALWKFNCELPSEVECFVREFDRLDAVGEKERLYLSAQVEM